MRIAKAALGKLNRSIAEGASVCFKDDVVRRFTLVNIESAVAP